MRKSRKLIYEPQPNATPDEAMQVLKVFTIATYPPEYKSTDLMLQIYDDLSPEAKRHFRIEETTTR